MSICRKFRVMIKKKHPHYTLSHTSTHMGWGPPMWGESVQLVYNGCFCIIFENFRPSIVKLDLQFLYVTVLLFKGGIRILSIGEYPLSSSVGAFLFKKIWKDKNASTLITNRILSSSVELWSISNKYELIIILEYSLLCFGGQCLFEAATIRNYGSLKVTNLFIFLCALLLVGWHQNL
jgi:hypothetical protein